MLGRRIRHLHSLKCFRQASRGTAVVLEAAATAAAAGSASSTTGTGLRRTHAREAGVMFRLGVHRLAPPRVRLEMVARVDFTIETTRPFHIRAVADDAFARFQTR